MPKQAELVVIGAGPGGYAAAFRAADLGKKVTLIDKDATLGGVCLNRGCIPSKALLHIAKTMAGTRELEDKGVSYGDPKVDIGKLREWKQNTIEKLGSGIEQMALARKVEVISGTAEFLSDKEIKVTKTKGKPQKLSFNNAIIATGSSSIVPAIFQQKDPTLMTSREALNLNEIPDSLLVVGGGYIGLELGTVYASLGSDVSVVEMLGSLLAGADKDLVAPLKKSLTKDFSDIYLNTEVLSIKKNKSGSWAVKMKSGTSTFQKSFSHILVAVGRRPNTKGIGLKNAGVELSNEGFIQTDAYCSTSVNNIFAIGDAAGQPMLAHKATHEGKAAAEVICGEPSVFEPRAIPAVIFTNPEIAWAGLTEIEAKEKGISYKTGVFPWSASGKAIAVGKPEGKTKILFDPDTNIILGGGIVGANAGDLISEIVLAIEMGADAIDLALSIHPHPTFSETAANAAEMYLGTITDLYVPKKK
ncbi:MAG: dihydrolipoyl dehydrogenase [Candidatus Marinimicrobia bacterium]|nr:dihydrolipoyl dehydrogenase [Candidatus Neomarinimicrobiota bacterium]